MVKLISPNSTALVELSFSPNRTSVRIIDLKIETDLSLVIIVSTTEDSNPASPTSSAILISPYIKIYHVNSFLEAPFFKIPFSFTILAKKWNVINLVCQPYIRIHFVPFPK
ncbi:hypothetical protein NPIL_149221 [Nephila pilipes]|uniref:Uncharacterized protein n=1 Tax=Nephila pilipes TaxID=299642 RepID=A0A8X6THT3_NEPPI|nr:hypothetical protein NPIL_149221 [Nephila pilipes]